MSGSQRAVMLRCLLMSAVGLLLVTTLIAVPVFTHGSAAAIPIGATAFSTQLNSVEGSIPNFWGPPYQAALQEPYQEATGGQRLVQYFDKARMEQTTANGPVTNGLLTIELMTGKRQFGDNTFAVYPPANIAIVGDPTNTFPTYASLTTPILPAKVLQSTAPISTVFKANDILMIGNTQLAADPRAAFGIYASDPSGKYAHNIPLAFSTFLASVPGTWQTAMGYPVTEAFWVNVTVNTTLTWVLVQPFERRILSYTPTNPAAFQVEMGNIGQHYYQWRYLSNPGGIAGPPTATPLPTAISTPDSCATIAPVLQPTTTLTPVATATPTATPTTCTTPTATSSAVGVEFRNFRQTELTDTTFGISFQTNLAATSYIRYGTSSGAYPNAVDIATTATTTHSVRLTGLAPGTTYYFTIRLTSSADSINRSEDYFITTSTGTSTGATPVRPGITGPTTGSATTSATPIRVCPPGLPAMRRQLRLQRLRQASRRSNGSSQRRRDKHRECKCHHRSRGKCLPTLA